MPIQIKDTVVSVPIKIGSKTYENTFYVLIEAASQCLPGLNFFGTNNCDALFSEGKLKTDKNTFVLLYRRELSFDEKKVYRAVALEKISIPPQHVMIVLGTIPGWKAPPVARVASLNRTSASLIMKVNLDRMHCSVLKEGIFLITIANTKDEVSTIYKHKTMGLSQLVSDRLIQEVNEKQIKDYNTVDPKYDLEKIKNAISKEMN